MACALDSDVKVTITEGPIPYFFDKAMRAADVSSAFVLEELERIQEATHAAAWADPDDDPTITVRNWTGKDPTDIAKYLPAPPEVWYQKLGEKGPAETEFIDADTTSWDREPRFPKLRRLMFWKRR